MKPLTIDELKTLKVGDWVWVVCAITGNEYGYAQKIDEGLLTSVIVFNTIEDRFWLGDYGKTWLAYKNKEQAEAKGDTSRFNEIYDYLYDYLNNAVTCIDKDDNGVIHVNVDGWAKFDLIIDLSNAKFYD